MLKWWNIEIMGVTPGASTLQSCWVHCFRKVSIDIDALAYEPRRFGNQIESDRQFFAVNYAEGI